MYYTFYLKISQLEFVVSDPLLIRVYKSGFFGSRTTEILHFFFFSCKRKSQNASLIKRNTQARI